MNKILAAILVSSATVFGGAAHALTFSGHFDGDWVGSSDFDGSGSLDDQGENADWGNSSNPNSQMTIYDGEFDHVLMPGHNLYELGYIEWYNGVWTNFDTDGFNLWADWDIVIDEPIVAATDDDFTPVDGGPGFVEPEDKDYFDFFIDTTNNNNANSDDLAVGATLENLGLDVPLDLGGGYTLDGIVLTLGEQGVGSLIDNGDGTYDWENPEHGYSYLVFNAEISGPSPVPLPAAGWMLLAGVGGMAAMRRRKKKAA